MRLAFGVESGTDIRLVLGLAKRFDLDVLVRSAFGGREINWPLPAACPVRVHRGPASRAGFAAWVLGSAALEATRRLNGTGRAHHFVLSAHLAEAVGEDEAGNGRAGLVEAGGTRRVDGEV